MQDEIWKWDAAEVAHAVRTRRVTYVDGVVETDLTSAGCLTA